MEHKTNDPAKDDCCFIKQAEERNGLRRRVIKRGVVSINDGAVTHYCAVKDVSSSGAHLKFDWLVMLPERFWLYIEIDGLKVESQTKWRKGLEIGVKFLNEPIVTGAKRSQVVSSVA